MTPLASTFIATSFDDIGSNDCTDIYRGPSEHDALIAAQIHVSLSFQTNHVVTVRTQHDRGDVHEFWSDPVHLYYAYRPYHRAEYPWEDDEPYEPWDVLTARCFALDRNRAARLRPAIDQAERLRYTLHIHTDSFTSTLAGVHTLAVSNLQGFIGPGPTLEHEWDVHGNPKRAVQYLRTLCAQGDGRAALRVYEQYALHTITGVPVHLSTGLILLSGATVSSLSTWANR
ncbi:hypothetical protein [Deinococcus aquatilis]|uniref:hypothetical protein n=1 Tax=Deinococcus aquatilis TaxID=519440 RepID=UPI00036E2366|nr:hypothetical protein [Deinococcus aquatilis]